MPCVTPLRNTRVSRETIPNEEPSPACVPYYFDGSTNPYNVLRSEQHEAFLARDVLSRLSKSRPFHSTIIIALAGKIFVALEIEFPETDQSAEFLG